MNTEYQAHKISETAKTPNRLNAIWYKGNPYMVLNDDFSKKYKPNQYCTVLTRMYDEETTTALSSMSLNPDMEILNLPRAPFKMVAMEMLIKEIMANIQDMNNPSDGDFKRAFFAMVIDIAHRTSFLAQRHNAFIINSDAGMIDYSEHNRLYLRSDTSIMQLGYDTKTVESVFEYENFDRSITIFTLDEKVHPEGRNAIIIIINLKEDD